MCLTCVGRGRGGTAGGYAIVDCCGCPGVDVAAKVRFMSRDEEREWEGWGRGGGGGGATTFSASGDAPDCDLNAHTVKFLCCGTEDSVTKSWNLEMTDAYLCLVIGSWSDVKESELL